MTIPQKDSQQAAARYHAHYSNSAYVTIQRAVISDLFGSPGLPEWENLFDTRLGEEIPNRLMNLVIDAASELCGWPGFEGRLLRLTREAAAHRLSENTLNAIRDHLKRFEEAGDTRADDFRSVAMALQRAGSVQPDILKAARCASEIHSWRGRAAHDLLVAAEGLVRAAEILLLEDDAFYAREKVQRAVERVVSALKEGEHGAGPRAAFTGLVVQWLPRKNGS